MTQWNDFQSAIQLVAALNVALYGLPDLREPALVEAQAAENTLIEWANQKGLFADAVKFRHEFRQH